MTHEQLNTLIDVLGKVLFSYFKKAMAPTINILLSEIEKQIEDPAILADEYWKFQIRTFVEHLVKTGTLKRVGRLGKRFYVPGDKYDSESEGRI